MNLKKIIASFFLLISSTVVLAQLKTTPKCPDISIDILDGIVNERILATSTVGQIKLNLPCFTSFEEEGTSAKCGAGVFYKDKDVYFYTDRNYVEIGPAFKGKLSVPLMGASRDSLFKLLGRPSIKEAGWDAFQTSYGIMILYYNAEAKVNKIQFSSESTTNIKLCE